MGFETTIIRAGLCVVGGGIAGMCAAIAAARAGVSVALMHERPMFGGNASSEIRMWVCGAGGRGNRETGIIEEIALDNLYYNPYKSYPEWDSVLYEAVRREGNITPLLNCSCMDAHTVGGRIISVTGWQSTSQRFIKVEAEQFADCSGDSVLAPLTGAHFRVGRESKYEFGENIPEESSDRKTMGMSCLLQARKLDREVGYKAPPFAAKLSAEDIKFRRPNLESSYENFWYLELGGEEDSIGDTEKTRDRLLSLAYGMWDYIKNSGEFDAARWQLDFVGFLPGKRESRRMCGEYMMTQVDVMSGGRFPDTVAYGGWPLDDHDPSGFLHTGHPNTSYPTPSPYGIPLRALFSENIENLWFAGRNISMTHAAMSSSRVMATCALVGQAAGVAVACAIKHGVTPHIASAEYIGEIQRSLMDADCFIPYLRRDVAGVCRSAALSIENGAVTLGDIENLRNGADRNNHTYGDAEQGVGFDLGGAVKYELDGGAQISCVRIVFDSDLDRVTLPGDECERYHMTRCNTKPDAPVMTMPATLVRDFALDIVYADGGVRTVSVSDNRRRMVKTAIEKPDGIKAIKLRPTTLWGGEKTVHIFSFDFE